MERRGNRRDGRSGDERRDSHPRTSRSEQEAARSGGDSRVASLAQDGQGKEGKGSAADEAAPPLSAVAKAEPAASLAEEAPVASVAEEAPTPEATSKTPPKRCPRDDMAQRKEMAKRQKAEAEAARDKKRQGAAVIPEPADVVRKVGRAEAPMAKARAVTDAEARENQKAFAEATKALRLAAEKRAAEAAEELRSARKDGPGQPM